MRVAIIALTACAACVFIYVAASGAALTTINQTDAAQEVDPKILAFLKPVGIDDGDSELQKKLKERHNVAVRMLDERVNEYKTGVRDVSSVFEAARLTADAKLDLADTGESRLATLDQVLEVAKLFESQLEQQLANGFGSKADLERARFGRLSVEIEILKAKSD
jgi:hypothetical protein